MRVAFAPGGRSQDLRDVARYRRLFGQNGHHSGLCQRFAQTTSLVFRLPYQFARTWYAELGIDRRCLLLPVNNRNVQKSALFVGFVLLVALAVHFTGFEMWSLPPHLVDQCDKQGTDWAPISLSEFCRPTP